ncbi:hypothetical protein [Streptantibioticus ferralitis]|uniref:Uncharacterized protein n=1 Tax=Streptantibioticus ferralitis TaxID=236510 RepID=A0ABT5Z748_9ACTN|nr:hypothetical protein [Streptantibioticus ferralitis]MDF2259661.1 hypothetical protein [Streptantibioticus ferralitis]
MPESERCSSDPVRRVSQYQTAAVNARLRLLAILAASGLSADEADELVGALEAGAVASAHCDVVELEGNAPDERGEAYEHGWFDGTTKMTGQLVQIADRTWEQRGRAAGTAALSVHLADARQQERAELLRLRAFVDQMLEQTHPNTMERRRVLEVLGEAGGLCTARTVEHSTGDVIVCTREAGHSNPDDKPSWQEGKPGGWHHANVSMWDDSSASSHPHQPTGAGVEEASRDLEQ